MEKSYDCSHCINQEKCDNYLKCEGKYELSNTLENRVVLDENPPCKGKEFQLYVRV